eukprot:Nk52_evm4s258 gene=Nk52_evmTU4s258
MYSKGIEQARPKGELWEGHRKGHRETKRCYKHKPKRVTLAVLFIATFFLSPSSSWTPVNFYSSPSSSPSSQSVFFFASAVTTSSLAFTVLPSGDLDDAVSYTFTVQGSNGADEQVRISFTPVDPTLTFVHSTPDNANTTTLDGNSPSTATFTGIRFHNGDFNVQVTGLTSGVSVATSSPLKVYHKTLNLAALVPRSMFDGWGDNAEVAAKIAADMINANATLLPHTTVVVTGADTKCDKTVGVREALSLRASPGIDISIGPGCSLAAEVVVPTLNAYEIPVCSFAATSPEFSNKALYPNFLRTWHSAVSAEESMVALIAYLNITHVIAIDDDSFPFTSSFENNMRAKNITVQLQLQLKVGQTNFMNEIAAIKASHTSAIFFFSFSSAAALFFPVAAREGLVGYLGQTWIIHEASLQTLRSLNQTFNATHSLIDVYTGLVTTRATTTGGDPALGEEAARRWTSTDMKTAHPLNPNVGTTATWSEDKGVTGGLVTSGSTSFNAVYTSAYAAHNLIETQRRANLGLSLRDALFNVSFQGISGVVSFDKNGDVQVTYAAEQLRRDPVKIAESLAAATSASSTTPHNKALGDTYGHTFALLRRNNNGVFVVQETYLTAPDSKGWIGMQWLDPNSLPQGAMNATTPPIPPYACPTPCSSNGKCTGPDTCTCNRGWISLSTEKMCATAVCTSCNTGQGQCVFPEVIALENAQAIAANVSLAGQLVTEYCSCFSGWKGVNCTETDENPLHSVKFLVPVCVGGLCVLILCIVVVKYFRHAKDMKLRRSMDWLIPFDTLTSVGGRPVWGDGQLMRKPLLGERSSVGSYSSAYNSAFSERPLLGTGGVGGEEGFSPSQYNQRGSFIGLARQSVLVSQGASEPYDISGSANPPPVIVMKRPSSHQENTVQKQYHQQHQKQQDDGGDKGVEGDKQKDIYYNDTPQSVSMASGLGHGWNTSRGFGGGKAGPGTTVTGDSVSMEGSEYTNSRQRYHQRGFSKAKHLCCYQGTYYFRREVRTAAMMAHMKMKMDAADEANLSDSHANNDNNNAHKETHTIWDYSAISLSFYNFKKISKRSHINEVIGFVLDTPPPIMPFLVETYQHRGSIMDRIVNDSNPLDPMFVFSILSDILSGLKAISHSPLKYHGNLTLNHCLIDSHWNVRLSGFGFSSLFRVGCAQSDLGQQQQQGANERTETNEEHHWAHTASALHWCAPELYDIRNAPENGGGGNNDVDSVNINDGNNTAINPIVNASQAGSSLLGTTLTAKNSGTSSNCTRISSMQSQSVASAVSASGNYDVDHPVVVSRVQDGSSSGDVYSFGVALASLVNWDIPYAYQLEYLSSARVLVQCKEKRLRPQLHRMLITQESEQYEQDGMTQENEQGSSLYGVDSGDGVNNTGSNNNVNNLLVTGAKTGLASVREGQHDSLKKEPSSLSTFQTRNAPTYNHSLGGDGGSGVVGRGGEAPFLSTSDHRASTPSRATNLNLQQQSTANVPKARKKKFSPQKIQTRLSRLLWRCTAHNPGERLALHAVAKELHQINPNRGKSVMDSIMSKLELYARNLEDKVHQRTAELELEKEKTDRLLNSLMPPAVAEKLKAGLVVPAEAFDNVTVFFSDIVGFTTISAMCTPMQVVSLLNSLYTRFDAQIARLRVFKVETIGDAYMVVGGVPHCIADHCIQVCTMALALMREVHMFPAPDYITNPKMSPTNIAGSPRDKKNAKTINKIQLRMGIHSGPVVAGIIGVAMPQYTIFGDTVNMASRMESGSLALRIQLSVDAHQELRLEEKQIYADQQQQQQQQQQAIVVQERISHQRQIVHLDSMGLSVEDMRCNSVAAAVTLPETEAMIVKEEACAVEEPTVARRNRKLSTMRMRMRGHVARREMIRILASSSIVNGEE